MPPPQSRAFPPLARAGPAPRSVGVCTVLLHGRGRNAAEMIDLAARLALPEMPFVAPDAIEGTWYPESFLAPRARNEPALSRALGHVEAIVRALEDEDGIGRERVALVGFSQGACLAVEHVFRTATTPATRYGALAALTGGLIGPPETTWSAPPGRLDATPVLLATSDVDEWVPLARVEATASVFRALGARVDLRVYPGRSHAVSDDEIRATRELLAPLLER